MQLASRICWQMFHLITISKIELYLLKFEDKTDNKKKFETKNNCSQSTTTKMTYNYSNSALVYFLINVYDACLYLNW